MHKLIIVLTYIWKLSIINFVDGSRYNSNVLRSLTYELISYYLTHKIEWRVIKFSEEAEMSIYQRIKDLVNDKHISIAQI